MIELAIDLPLTSFALRVRARIDARAVAILGPKADVINTIGYSYLLRGDLSHARAKFEEAQLKDPDNPTVANNLALVDEAERRHAGVN